jgi:hypothetical protein
MAKAARDTWNKRRRQRFEGILADLENGRLQRRIVSEVRAALADLDSERVIERGRIEMINHLHNLRRNG